MSRFNVPLPPQGEEEDPYTPHPEDWDEEDPQNGPEYAEAAEQFVEDQFATEPEVSPEPLSEVENRIELASMYKLLLSQSMFTTVTPHTRIVEKEVRDFIKNRLAVLLGIQPDSPVGTSSGAFSSEEVTALKAVASKLLKSPSVLAPPKPKAPPPRPQVAKVEIAQKPSPARPRVRPAAAPAQPQVRQAVSQKPESPQPRPRPVRPVQTQPQRPQPAQPAPRAEQPQPEGTLRGRKLPGLRRKILKPTGEFNEKGEEILADVTPQARSRNAKPLPMPPPQVVSQMAAGEADARLAGSNPLIVAAINQSLSTVTAEGETNG